MRDWGWPRRGFLNLLGLDHPQQQNGKECPVELAEAEVDSRTGGAVAVTTKAMLDDKDGKTHLRTYYWRMMPDGQQQSIKLFDIELAQAETTTLASDGRTVTIPTMMPRAVWVLGNCLYDATDDGDLAEDGLPYGSKSLMQNLSNVMGAVGEINKQMRRNKKLPDVAQILKRYDIKGVSGHSVTIVGQSEKGGFNFDAVPAHEVRVNGKLAVPDAVAKALMGFDVNTLDKDNTLQPEMVTQTTDPRTGIFYATEAKVKKGAHPSVAIKYALAWDFHAKPDSIPNLTQAAWKSNEEGWSTLEEFNLLGEQMSDEHHHLRMQAMGATNRIMHDMRDGRYPRTVDHLTEYGLHDLVAVAQQTKPPPFVEGGRLTMTSVGGNNMEPVVDGFGEAIGGNCKVVCHEGLDENGKTNRVGVIVDLGLHLSPKDEPNIAAAPDVIGALKYCNDILITHRHLDHTDGLFAYIQYGYLRGKTVHATPEVIRSIADKLSTYPSIRPSDVPTFAPLLGTGWLHVKDKQRNIRLSVNYARNATPHSTRTTPFIVHGHHKGKWIGSYLNPGDARYGRHNANDYTGKLVDVDKLDKKFFTKSNQHFLDEMQRLVQHNQMQKEVVDRFDKKIAERGPTYFDMDVTSIQKDGWGTTEAEVEDNLCKISGWFKDKGMALAMISTNDNRYETALRVGTRAHRDITEFGANLQKTATTMNVLGVNDLRHEPEIRNNILPYMDQYFEQRLRAKIKRHKEKLETTTEKETRKVFEKKIERHEARLELFEKLKKIKSAAARYSARAQMEAGLKERFERKTTLGSQQTEYELTLGAIRVGRTSKTARRIMSMDDGDAQHGDDSRRLVLLTGTQGTNVEVDAALTGMAEGRHPVLNGNAKSSHTARPLVSENNFVVISQSAIPGNDNKQADLVRKLVKQSYSTVQAIHDGFIIHFAPQDLLPRTPDASNPRGLSRAEQIQKSLSKLKKPCTLSDDGTQLTVSGMPIHASGHGHRKDCKAWVNMVKADVTAPQHTSSLESGKRLAKICADAKSRYMGRVVPNFETIDIKAGDSAESTQITTVGKSISSLIRVETIKQQRKYHGGYLKATQIANLDIASSITVGGLLATAREGSVFKKAFAHVDAEVAARAHSRRNPGRPELVPENRMTPPGERLDRGADIPGWQDRHQFLDQAKRGRRFDSWLEKVPCNPESHDVTPAFSAELSDPSKDGWLRKQFDFDHVEHLIETGRFLSLNYDFETTDLNTMFADPTMFCGKVVTLDGHIIDTVKMNIRVPKDSVVSPQAVLVTQSSLKEMYGHEGREDPHIAAAKIMLYFRNPYRALWDQLADKAIYIKKEGGKKDEKEEVRVYTLTSPDGTKKKEIRIHQGGKFISMRYPDRFDHYSEVMQQCEDKPKLAETTAAVLGVPVTDIFDSEMQSFKQEVIAERIRHFKGEMAAFAEAIHTQMGEAYPLALHQLPDADQQTKGLKYWDADKTRWRRIAAPAMTQGHNISRFDDRLLWAFLHRHMGDEIFLTHTKKFQRFRLDTLSLAKLVAQLDDGSQNSFKTGTKIDAKTNQTYTSYTLSSLMEANTRDANPERGIDEGVRMPDGSKYDRALAHQDPEYDVLACMSLHAYMRKRVPDAVRIIEENADFDQLKPFLIGGSDGFEIHPLRGFTRNIYPNHAQMHLGICVGINEEIEERRRALLIRTDIGIALEEYTYRGKKLLEMSDGELRAMLDKQLNSRERDSEALFESISLRKNPAVVPKEMVIARGAGGNLDLNEANRRFILANRELVDKLMKAHSATMPPMSDHSTIRNPQGEEHLFTGLAVPKRYEYEMDGKQVMVPESVHQEWVKVLRRNRNIDAVLHRALKPQTIEIEVRPDTLEAFIERMDSVNKALQKYYHTECIMLPPPEYSFIPRWDEVPNPDKPGKTKKVPHVMSQIECKELTHNAVEYLWKLRAELMYEFHDNSTQYTVQNRYGQDIPFPVLNRNEDDTARRINSGEWHVVPEELNYSAELLARMFKNADENPNRIEWVKKYFADQGRSDQLQNWERWERYFEAKPALNAYGAPHENTDVKRWITAEKGLKEVDRIRANLRLNGDLRAEENQWGLWDIFMRNSAKAEHILNECEAYYKSMMEKNPLTPQKMQLLGYDPDTKFHFPILHAPYEIPSGAKTLTFDVPDLMLEQPLSHTDVAHSMVMLELTPKQRKALEEAGPDTCVFLRGAQTGRKFLAVKHHLLSADEITPSYYFDPVYNDAENRFWDSGVNPPPREHMAALAVEALEPVRAKVNDAAQTVKIPRWIDFMATVSEELGARQTKLAGLAIKDAGYTPTIGAARLQGMVADEKKTGVTESGWEVPTTIRCVHTTTLEEAKERIKIGRQQIRVSVALGFDSVEAARAAVTQHGISQAQAKEAGFKTLRALQSLMKKESFTEDSALHYGYANLSAMLKDLTAMFIDHERQSDDKTNLIHFIDFDTAEKAQMIYHNPARRTMLRVAPNVVDITPPSEGPDPSRVHGAPVIDRGRGASHEQGA